MRIVECDAVGGCVEVRCADCLVVVGVVVAGHRHPEGVVLLEGTRVVHKDRLQPVGLVHCRAMLSRVVVVGGSDCLVDSDVDGFSLCARVGDDEAVLVHVVGHINCHTIIIHIETFCSPGHQICIGDLTKDV